MNSRMLLLAPGFALLASAFAQQVETPTPPTPPAAVAQNFPSNPAPVGAAGGQRVYGPTADTLIARQAADGILENFRKTYKTDHAPRIVV
jgi:hypothetical protein